MKERGVVIVFESESADLLPTMPGVYMFKDALGEVLYVGKAKDLRKRVRSYFRLSKDASPKLHLLARRAKTIEYIVCSSERDALILEDTLIKRLRPRYNVRLRDDKSYPFIKIQVGAEFPRIMLTRRKAKDGAIYIGPYTSADLARKTLRFIANTFGLRTCTDNVMKTQKRPCLRAQLGHCLAPCVVQDEEIKEQYESGVRAAIDVLMGRGTQVIRGLKDAMERAAELLEFEKAARLRDQIAAIESLTAPQEILFPRIKDIDAVGIAMDTDGAGLAVVTIIRLREGRVTGKSEYLFETVQGEEPSEVLRAFLLEKVEDIESNEVIIPHPLHDQEAVVAYLEEIRGKALKVLVPQRGDKKRLLEFAQKNADHALSRKRRERTDWERLEADFRAIFGHSVDPSWIECVDVSHTSGDKRVGALVCFKEGVPYKDGYRLFNLSGTHGADDYGGIREVIKRRAKAIEREGKGPTILIIDGGRGQLNVAREALGDVSDAPFLMSIAKARSGKKIEKIYTLSDKDPIFVSGDELALRFIQRIRDEAHRFAISAHRKKRLKAVRTSILEEIPGVGKKRKEMLLRRFGGLRGIIEASCQELQEVPGISAQLANLIKERIRELEP